jgi:hypothetical protein
MQKYLKFLAALAATALMVLASSLTDSHISTAEWVQVAVSVTAAAGVWITANVPTLAWAKTAVAAVLAGLNLVATFVVSGGFSAITTAEWINVALAVLGALGVYAIPNLGADTYEVVKAKPSGRRA